MMDITKKKNSLILGNNPDLRSWKIIWIRDNFSEL